MCANSAGLELHIRPIQSVNNLAVGGFMVSKDSRWSKAADDATREAFHESELGMLGDLLHCKHSTDGFGTVRVDRVLKDRIELLEEATDRMTIFRSVEELIHAGWTID
jgi:hypothetical protein